MQLDLVSRILHHEAQFSHSATTTARVFQWTSLCLQHFRTVSLEFHRFHYSMHTLHSSECTLSMAKSRILRERSRWFKCWFRFNIKSLNQANRNEITVLDTVYKSQEGSLQNIQFILYLFLMLKRRKKKLSH